MVVFVKYNMLSYILVSATGDCKQKKLGKMKTFAIMTAKLAQELSHLDDVIQFNI